MEDRKRVLVVEDDASLADLVRDYLEAAGYAPELAADGASAIARLRAGACDLALLDLMLPGVDGFDVLRAVRAETDIPILVVSARREDVDKLRAFGLGADDYVPKPFSPGELMARVKAHLAKVERLRGRGGGAEGDRPVRVRGLEVHPLARRVLVHGTEVALAQKEFDLLLFLLRNPDRVFSRNELFERLWGVDALGDVSTVTVHVARVREKIETHPEDAPYIETVWGAGYRFRA